MVGRRAFLGGAVAAAMGAVAERVEAQPGARTFEEWRAAGGGIVSVRTTWEPDKRASVMVGRVDDMGKALGETTNAYRGPAVLTTMAVRGTTVLVVLWRGGESPAVSAVVVELEGGAVRPVPLHRSAPKGYAPTSAVACVEGDAFVVLWQEERAGDPSAEAHTTLARIKSDGTVAARVVPIPWALGAVVDDGRGLTLAVSYDGAAPDQSRLCFVTLSREGNPEQHPVWGTRTSVVGDVQLVRSGATVTAVYRGGADGRTLMSTVVAMNVQTWGREPDASKTLGTLAGSKPFAARADDKGAVGFVAPK